MIEADPPRRATTLVAPGDPRLDDYRDLRSLRPRVRESALDHVVVEGALALERVVAQGPPLRSVLVTPRRAATLDLLARVPPEVPVLVLEREHLRDLTGFDVHRGVLASAERPTPRSPGDLLGAEAPLVATEGLRDLENLGSVFRVAAAFGAAGVVVDPGGADPLYRRCVRVSQGWSACLPHAVADTDHLLERAHAAGRSSVALSPSGDTPVDRATATGLLGRRCVVVVGSEGPGLLPSTLAACTHRVAVPMADGVDSLNVAGALAVALAFGAAASGWPGARV